MTQTSHFTISQDFDSGAVVTPEPSFGMEAGFYENVGRNYMLALCENVATTQGVPQ